MWSGERTRKSVLTSKNGALKQKRDYTPVSSPLQAGIKISFIRLGQAAALFAHLSSHPFLLVSASSSFLSFPYSWERKEGNCLVQDCDPALRTSTHPPYMAQRNPIQKKNKKKLQYACLRSNTNFGIFIRFIFRKSQCAYY